MDGTAALVLPSPDLMEISTTADERAAGSKLSAASGAFGNSRMQIKALKQSN